MISIFPTFEICLDTSSFQAIKILFKKNVVTDDDLDGSLRAFKSHLLRKVNHLAFN